ncbi:MAG: sigma-70 family RNA polymerase sigma factor [Planctomycetota bacterium]|nr:sigma-70 family RNA polymerase sigma factor [Planctomycetota bacterium]
MEDHELLQRAGEGDLEAYNKIVRKYQLRLLRYCYRYLLDAQLAEDAVQEVFVKVFKYAPKFEPRATVSAFLYTVARNQCLDMLKSRKRKSSIPFSQMEAGSGESRSMEAVIESDAPLPERNLMVDEAREAFHDALEELPEKHRSALMLFELEHLSYKEIAQVLDASLGEVKIGSYLSPQELTSCSVRMTDENP